MHCALFAILSRLPYHAVSTHSPFCTELPLNRSINQSVNQLQRFVSWPMKDFAILSSFDVL